MRGRSRKKMEGEHYMDYGRNHSHAIRLYDHGDAVQSKRPMKYRDNVLGKYRSTVHQTSGNACGILLSCDDDPGFL